MKFGGTIEVRTLKDAPEFRFEAAFRRNCHGSIKPLTPAAGVVLLSKRIKLLQIVLV